MSIHPTCFSHVYGNESVKKQLNCMLSKNAIGHSLLFSGPDGVGKSLFAQVLAAKLFSQDVLADSHIQKIQKGVHPDVHIYRPEGKLGLHSIQSMRKLSEEVWLPPHEANWKIFIILDADRMLNYSANALLKTFEEPPPKTLILLLSSAKKSLLPTILSRCRIVHFQPLSQECLMQIIQERCELSANEYEKIANCANGSAERALRLAEKKGDPLRAALFNLLAKNPVHSYRFLQEEIKQLCDQIEAARKQAEENIKEELKNASENFSPIQFQAIEKELEGFLSVSFFREAKFLFEYYLSWFSDMQVIQLGGNPSDVINTDYFAELKQAVEQQNSLSLKEVYCRVSEAYSSLQSSTPLSLCLESIFLKGT